MDKSIILKICILIIGIQATLIASFDHNVVAKCSPEEKICEFQLKIEQRRNMAVYGRPKNSQLARDNARLLEIRDGNLLIHNNSACGEWGEVTDTEVKDAITADGEKGFVYTINGHFPGPTLTVYEGQEVAVKVTNLLYQESLTIHWHGMRQKNTNWMDGVPAVTQCAINPQQSFMYRFIASPAGTHWYHSHQGAQRSDGMYGALVVLPKPRPKQTKPENRHGQNGDYMVLIQDKFPEDSKVEFHNFYNGISEGKTPCYKPDKQVDGTTIAPIQYYSALINGKGYPLSSPVTGLPLERFSVRYGLSYRFRLVNPALLYTFKFSIDEHKLSVVATDGMDLVPTSADAVYLTPGERYDVVIQANQPLHSYWIRVETLHWNLTSQTPIPQSVHAILDYSSQQTTNSTATVCSNDRPCVHVNCPFREFPDAQYISCLHIEDLQSKHNSDIHKTADKEIFLNFHYANTTDGGIRSAINGIQHLPSSVSTSSQHKQFEHKCDKNQCENGRPCRCTHQLDVPSQSVIHMVFFTQMWYAGSALIGSSHPVHMHGHHFEVIKVGYPEIDPVTKVYKAMSPDIVCNNDACNSASWNIINGQNLMQDKVNVVNPPKKDTVHVPAGGYVVVRYVTDNPGFWMLHCHIENHNLEGMALIVKEGDYQDMNPSPPHFPQCGSFHLSEEDFRASLTPKSHNTIHIKAWYILTAFVILLTVTNIIVPAVIYKCTKRKKISPRRKHRRLGVDGRISVNSSFIDFAREEVNPEYGSGIDMETSTLFSDNSFEYVESASESHRPDPNERTHLI